MTIESPDHHKRRKTHWRLCLYLLAICHIAAQPALAADTQRLKARVETNIRAGTERSIMMTEAWVPLAQERDKVIYGDIRITGDDGDNREWNVGIGYRETTPQSDAVLGVHGWLDRRRSSRGSIFHQVAGGVEYLSNDLDVRVNGYIPFNEEERYATPITGSATPYLADTGIFYDTNGQLVEKPLHGIDVTFSVPIKALEKTFDSFRVSAGGFVFSGDDVETLRGVRVRTAANVTSDIEIGARFETDNERGAQAFAEATFRFPFGSKASQRTLGLRSRLDESPERDIDVITADTVTDTGIGRVVLSTETGTAQRVFHVDNTAAPGGDGSLSNPFNTLAAAKAAATQTGDIIYVNAGDGTATGQDQGVSLTIDGQSLIGAGVDFVYDGNRFTTATAAHFTGAVLKAATSAPVISNVNASGDGIFVSANDIVIAGLTVENATQNGIRALTNGVARSGLLIQDVTTSGNGNSGVIVNAPDSSARWDGVTLSNITAHNNTAIGVYLSAQTGGQIQNVHLENINAYNNPNRGVYLNAQTGGQIQDVHLENINSHDNPREGVYFLIRTGGQIQDVRLENINAYNNAQNGVYFLTQTGGQIHDLHLENINAYNNVQNGIRFQTQTGGQIHDVLLENSSAAGNLLKGIDFSSGDAGSLISGLYVANSSVTGNAQHGISLTVNTNGAIDAARLDNVDAVGNTLTGLTVSSGATGGLLAVAISNTTATGNALQGVVVNDDTTAAFSVDLGGGPLASAGGNRFFGNTGVDLQVDLDGLQLKAENNWWGNPAGLLPSRVTLQGGSSVDSDPWLLSDPGP